MSQNSFEPYPDFEKITQEDADELHQLFRDYRQKSDRLEQEARVEYVADFLQSFHAMNVRIEETVNRIWTVPYMVHVAGDKKTEQNPDDPTEEGIFQRCSRCGSTLNFWREGLMFLTPDGPKEMAEEDVPWWTPGERIAKRDGGPQGYGMYRIDADHELEKHEIMCVSLESLVGDGDLRS